ncbi:hypothetical protein K0M31_014600 [Melipona bicolor]|uniref:Uncharacterized protein n=1 Tax=Melipona bicolor TaxID=60889 RepID=A0AA40KFV0_9HYME|nr:hypothetical protein K0M31_014600 [Melipona bicolor]
MMTAMARLPCKQTSPSQQPRVNNFGNSRNTYWNMQTRHPAPPYVRNHQRHTDHTVLEVERESVHLAARRSHENSGAGASSLCRLVLSPFLFLIVPRSAIIAACGPGEERLLRHVIGHRD